MGGSVRIPAACCGLVGFKPQRGRRPRGAADHRWSGLREPGPLTHTVRDTVLLNTVLGGPRPAPPPVGLRVGLVLGPDDGRGAVATAAELLQTLGHTCTVLSPLPVLPVAVALPRYLRGAADEVALLGPDALLERRTAQAARAGRLVPPAAVTAARWAAPAAEHQVRWVFRDVDVVLTPVLALPVPTLATGSDRSALAAGLEQSRLARHTALWNVTGHPALALPLHSTAAAHPGQPPPAIQLVGRPWQDATVLALGLALEQLLAARGVTKR